MSRHWRRWAERSRCDPPRLEGLSTAPREGERTSRRPDASLLTTGAVRVRSSTFGRALHVRRQRCPHTTPHAIRIAPTVGGVPAAGLPSPPSPSAPWSSAAPGSGSALSAGATTPAGTPAGCSSSQPRLTVQGTGQADGTPDVLTAVFGFSSTAPSATAALSQNNAEVNQALLALSGKGVAQSDVQTTGLTLAPQYAYPHGVPTRTGFARHQHGDGDLAGRQDRRRRHRRRGERDRRRGHHQLAELLLRQPGPGGGPSAGTCRAPGGRARGRHGSGGRTATGTRVLAHGQHPAVGPRALLAAPASLRRTTRHRRCRSSRGARPRPIR